MAEWTPEATEYLDGYLKQVRALARGAGEDGEEIASGLREHIAAKTEEEAGPLITLDVLRRVLAEMGSPEAIIESGAHLKAPPMPKTQPGSVRLTSATQAPAPVARDRSGKFVRWTLGCVLALVALLIAVPVLSIVAAIFIPAISRSREAARRAECQNHLKQIGMAIEAWENDHPNEDDYPKKMSELYPKYIQDIEAFACPSSPNTDRAPERIDEWSAYEFDPNWTGNDDDPIIREKEDTYHTPKGRHVMFNKGNVAFVSISEAYRDPSTKTFLELNTDDPESVARAFLAEMSVHNVNEAQNHVVERQRKLLENAVDSFPVLPPHFEIKSEPVSDKLKAGFRVVGTDIGVDLVYENGRWWVVK